ncbi:methyltransferase regulatory domain-containing protein [Kaarinaea lacus]
MATIQDYDEIPYADCPIVESHPDHLSTIGKLFGLDCAPPNDCKVLELGCASGGNLIPMAFYWPQSQFVGVELSQHQAASGQQIIEQLQLSNIRIIHDNIVELSAETGKFDYILAHGIYSWVPKDVRDHIMKLCHDLLNPNGIAYVSYNTLPGWDFRKTLRDMMRYHGKSVTNAEAKLEKGLELLQLLYHGLPNHGSLSEQWLKHQALELLNKPASYIYHDYLEENNTPVYFSQFMEHAKGHQLQYLAEGALYTMLSSTLTPEAEEILDRFEDLVDYEQYLDFFYLKHFRQTLLCHDNREPNRDIDINRLQELYFSGFLRINDDVNLHDLTTQRFSSSLGDRFDISHPLTKAALVELGLAYPNTYSFPELLNRASTLVQEYGDAVHISDRDALLSELFNLYLSNGIHLSTVAREFPDGHAYKPKATALALLYATQNKGCVASVHHHSIGLNIFNRQLLQWCNGENTFADISELLNQRLHEDSDFHNSLETLFQNNLDEKHLASQIEQELSHLGQHGLLQS